MKEVISMRSIFVAILLGGFFLLGASSCATMPKESLAPGGVRLLSIDVPGAGIKANTSFPVNIFFEAVGEPEIQRVCFYGAWKGPNCFNIPYTTFGTKKTFQVHLPGINPGSHRVECYIEYIRGGETRKTNVIATQILVGT